jgi:hypothetical protein
MVQGEVVGIRFTLKHHNHKVASFIDWLRGVKKLFGHSNWLRAMHYVGFMLNYLVLGGKENIIFKIQT